MHKFRRKFKKRVNTGILVYKYFNFLLIYIEFGWMYLKNNNLVSTLIGTPWVQI